MDRSGKCQQQEQRSAHDGSGNQKQQTAGEQQAADEHGNRQHQQQSHGDFGDAHASRNISPSALKNSQQNTMIISRSSMAFPSFIYLLIV